MEKEGEEKRWEEQKDHFVLLLFLVYLFYLGSQKPGLMKRWQLAIPSKTILFTKTCVLCQFQVCGSVLFLISFLLLTVPSTFTGELCSGSTICQLLDRWWPRILHVTM